MKNKAALFAFALCLAALSAAAQSNRYGYWDRHTHITQGPSVIEETGAAATLSWTTDRPSVNHVRYRVWQSEWKEIHLRGRSTTHAIRLTELQPGRRIEWEILTHDGDVLTGGHFRARVADNAGARPGRNGGYGSHVPIYRADQPQTGQRLYTADMHEIRRVERQGWKSVGMVGYVAPQPSEIPVYRVWIPNGDHFYTTSAEERDEVVRQGGRDEGVLGYISKDPSPGTRAWHRMVSTKNGMHLYSADPHEVWEAVTHQGYRDEGVIGYIWMQ